MSAASAPILLASGPSQLWRTQVSETVFVYPGRSIRPVGVDGRLSGTRKRPKIAFDAAA
jgi:hypothetical protein